MAQRDIEVDPEMLHLSAQFVTSHADDLMAQQTLAQSRIEMAQSGLPELAAAAMAGTLVEWQATTQAFHARMTARGSALPVSAYGYEASDDRNARRLGHIGADGSRVDSR